MTKEWHMLVSKGSDFKRTYGWKMEAKLKEGEPKIVKRQKILYEALEFEFDPALIVDDIVYDRIEYDQSFMIKAASEFKKPVDPMLEGVVAILKKFTSRDRSHFPDQQSFLNALRAEIDRLIFMCEVEVMEIGENLLRKKMLEWKDAREFKIQRRVNNVKSGVRVAGAVLGGALATVSAVGSGGGVGLIGAVFAWYGCYRTLAGAVVENRLAYKGMYKLVAHAEDLKKKEYYKNYKGAVKSGAIRGFAGFSTVDTLQKLLSIIAQVEMKFAYFKVNEVKLAAKLNKFLDAQEKLIQELAKEDDRIQQFENLEEIERYAMVNDAKGKFFNKSELKALIDVKYKEMKKVLEAIKEKIKKNEGEINAMLVNHAGPVEIVDDASVPSGRAALPSTKGSDAIEDWIEKQRSFVSENNRVGGKLHLVENLTSTAINLGLNTVAGTALTYAPAHDSVKAVLTVNPFAAYLTEIKDVLMDPNNSLDPIMKAELLDVLNNTFQTPAGIDPSGVATTVLFDLEQMGLLALETTRAFSKGERQA